MDDLEYQIRRIALPHEGFYGAVWQTYSVSNKGLPVWDSAASGAVEAHLDKARRYPSALNVKNLYVAHALFKAADYSRRRNPPQLDRHVRNFHSTRTLAIDVDIKTGAFATTAAARVAILGMLAEIGLAPSFIVLTSAPPDPLAPAETSGMHVYLTLTRPLQLEAWKPMALNLVAILKHRGLVFDTGVTTDPVRILRSVGSLNRKSGEVRIARLDPDHRDGPDYDPDILGPRLVQHPPPGRTHNNPPPDHAHVDLAEVASAADWLLDHGHYGPGQYFHLRDLFFGLAQLAHERDELHDDARALFERINDATGREHARAMSWFDGAIDRAPNYAGQTRITLASTFKYALEMGWSPPLDDDQDGALFRARLRLRPVFDSDDYDRDAAAKQAERLAARIRDPAVRTALAPTLAFLLARDGWDEPAILDAIERLTGRRNAGLARWAHQRRVA